MSCCPADDVDRLREVAGRLLRQSREYENWYVREVRGGGIERAGRGYASHRGLGTLGAFGVRVHVRFGRRQRRLSNIVSCDQLRAIALGAARDRMPRGFRRPYGRIAR